MLSEEYPDIQSLNFAYINVRFRSLAFMGHEDYLVGTDGTVWSKKRNGVWRKLKPRRRGKGGYLRIVIEYESYLVHHLVLCAFVGPRPEGKVSRHYPDRNTSNNRLSNLRWGTPKENSADMVKHGMAGRAKVPKGEDNKNAKLNREQVREIRRLYSHGRLTQQELARRYRVGQVTISAIVRRKSWKHVGG